MSLYGALFSGVSGLQSQSSAMGAISDNVANVNTVGYKGTKVNFQTLVTAQVSVTMYSPGGVQSAPRMGVDIQGLLQATTSSTDFGLSGQGFFVVSDQAIEPSGYAYSRAGSFKVDKDGYLQNVSGYYLQGWPLDTWDGTNAAATVTYNNDTYMKAYNNENGEAYYINDNAVDSVNMQPLNLNTIGGTARASSTLSVGANLPADADIGNTEKTNALIFDSLGNSHNLLYTWGKEAQNAWNVEVAPPEGSTYIAIEDQAATPGVYFSAGRLDMTAVPEIDLTAPTSLTMTINTREYNFYFTDAANNFSDNATGVAAALDGTDHRAALATAIPSAAPPALLPAGLISDWGGGGNRLTVNGVEFYAVNDPAEVAGDRYIDVSAVDWAAGAPAPANAAKVIVANHIENWFDTNHGSGNYCIADTATDGQLIFHQNFNAPASDRSFQIDATNKTLSQVLDDLGRQVNTVLAMEFNSNNTYTAETATVGGTWGGRIAGENAITFRSGAISAEIEVDATALVNASGETVVMQDSVYTVPAPDTVKNEYAIEFNGDGTPNKFFGKDEQDASDPRGQIKIGWANGALNMDGGTVASGGSSAITQFWGNYNTADGMQQLSGDYQLNYVTQNGNRFGNYAGLSVSESGIVTALFDNGVQTPIFMIPVATFVNPNGMNPLTGNVFQQTDTSGLPVVREAGSAGAATVAQATLENSTVDLGEEFTTMITTQRAYSAAAKIITTSDDMLEELIRIKR